MQVLEVFYSSQIKGNGQIPNSLNLSEYLYSRGRIIATLAGCDYPFVHVCWGKETMLWSQLCLRKVLSIIFFVSVNVARMQILERILDTKAAPNKIRSNNLPKLFIVQGKKVGRLVDISKADVYFIDY